MEAIKLLNASEEEACFPEAGEKGYELADMLKNAVGNCSGSLMEVRALPLFQNARSLFNPGDFFPERD